MVRGNTKKPIPAPMKDIERKGELRLLGVTFKATETRISIISFIPRLVIDYTLRVCKYYGYYLQELTLLFDGDNNKN